MIGTLFSLGQLIPIMSASMIAPCLPSIAWSLHISASASQITMSSYFLGMAFAPLLIASCSEIYGRKKAWVVCNVVYIVGNAVCGIEKGGLAVMVLGRIVSGAGASVGVTVSYSSL
jgi:MFS family permease